MSSDAKMPISVRVIRWITLVRAFFLCLTILIAFWLMAPDPANAWLQGFRAGAAAVWGSETTPIDPYLAGQVIGSLILPAICIFGLLAALRRRSGIGALVALSFDALFSFSNGAFLALFFVGVMIVLLQWPRARDYLSGADPPEDADAPSIA